MTVGLSDLTRDRLPEVLPVFPLSGVLLLPGGRLPLNVFEPRYLNMVEDALGDGRMIGTIQPRADAGDPVPDDAALYDVGCAGRITQFSETEDGRFLITLAGVARFRVEAELAPRRGYRRVRPGFDAFAQDLAEDPGHIRDRARLLQLLGLFFRLKGIEAEWKAIEGATDTVLATSLVMICPFESREKQALLECAGIAERGDLLVTLMEIAVHGEEGAAGAAHH